MQVRANKKAPSKGQPPMQPAQAFSFPPPIRGLVLNESISQPSPGGALVLDNAICTIRGAKVRGGTSLHIPLGGAVKSLFTYRSGGVEIGFGATQTTIRNISTSGTSAPASVVSGRTSGAYSTQQFGTAGGDYLYAVNGSDNALLFNGSTWTAITSTSTPAITGVVTSTLSQVWSFANRLFFVKKGTLTAYYLPVDSIGGAANQVSLAGIFKKGGALLFGATWSMDAGDGLDDKCIFVSDQGEVAVYEGTNPGDANNWRKAGVYNITPPLGPKGKMQAGGDLLIATQVGLVPLSQAISRDPAALEMSAVTKNITPLWQQKAFELGAGYWDIEKWPSENIMIVSQPGDNETTCLVCNLQTGAWSRFTGLNVQCLMLFDGSVMFGGVNGNVMRFESGGTDNGEYYTFAYLGQHDSMGIQGLEKTVAQMRATFQLTAKIAPQVSIKVDYDQTLSAPPNTLATGVGDSTWGVSNWGAAKWAANIGTQAFWTSAGRTGYVMAPEVQMTFGGVIKPQVELAGIDVTFHVGALVT